MLSLMSAGMDEDSALADGESEMVALARAEPTVLIPNKSDNRNCTAVATDDDDGDGYMNGKRRILIEMLTQMVVDRVIVIAKPNSLV